MTFKITAEEKREILKRRAQGLSGDNEGGGRDIGRIATETVDAMFKALNKRRWFGATAPKEKKALIKEVIALIAKRYDA